MANQQAPRDGNLVPTLLAVDDTTGETRPVKVDSDGNILIAATIVSGGVSGPVSSTDNAIVRWNGTDGSTVKDSTVVIDNSGNVTGLGNATGVAGGITITGGTGAGDDLTFASTSNATKGYIVFGSTAGAVFDQVNNRLAIGVDGTENTVVVNGTTYGSTLTVHAEGATDVAEFSVHRHSNSAALGSHFIALRSRGTEASETVVQNNDVLSRIDSLGFDGTDYEIAAQIDVEVDAAPGNNDMPGRMVFKTTPNGSVTPTEAMRITSAQLIQISGVNISPIANDGTALGTSSLSFSDLFLASGGVINFDNGDATITHSANTLTVGGANLIVSSPGTAAGSVATIDGSQTLTNKTIGVSQLSGQVSVANGGTGASTLTANNVILGNGTSAVQFVAPGTSGNVLTSNGTTWTSAAPSASSTGRWDIPLVGNNVFDQGTAPTSDFPSYDCRVTTDGAISGKYASLQTGTTNFSIFDKNPRYITTMMYNNGSSTGNGIVWFGFNVANTAPTTTQTTESALFIVTTVAGTSTLYAVSANGTTNENTTVAAITLTDLNIYEIKITSSNALFYVNGTLVATHTNKPSGVPANVVWASYCVKNDAGDTTTRGIRIGYPSVQMDLAT